MENEIKDDLEVLQDQEGENLNQDENLENQEGEDNITISKKEFQTLQAQKEHWRKKAQEKKDIEEKKDITPKKDAPSSQSETLSALTREEAILFAKGLSEKEVERAQKIAQVENMKLTEAVESDLFTSWKKLEDEKVKNAKANLPPSRGSKGYQAKTFQTQGLTEQEHKELFKAKL